MEQRINLITLGVDDLGRARRFYEGGLGWQPVQEAEDIVFYKLGEGFILALWPRELLREDAKLATWGQGGFTLAQNYPEREQVDAAMNRAVAAGATLLKAAEETPWGGYSGYVADPEGNVWEFAAPVLEIMK
jgi:catechol 2,3-dioxygenase-like lactoylglutathione lyase family enzyme